MSIRERIERLEPRERQLLRVLLGVFAALIALLLPLGVSAMVGARRDENASLSDAISRVQASRGSLKKRDSDKEAVAARYASPAPPLAAMLEKLAGSSGIEIPESQDRPLVPHGKHYDERATKIVLRKVGLSNLSKFMEKIVTSGSPVGVSRLNVRKRGAEPDSYDVEMEVSAWDRKAESGKLEPGHAEPAPADEPAEPPQ